ncbi:META domain-containing protein [Hymenobacter aerophilus]|uniref:META domain-containing protein n=1 Tax=Hymenobacter aerophilus TaxID=119644 RepID=UPI000374481B|nr:META domain-containing protein [Hymenobacter aerophilus]
MPLLLPAALLLGSCSKGQEPMPAPLYLLDQTWQLSEQQGQPVEKAPAPDGAATLTLSSLGNVGTGQAGCASYRNTFLLVAGTDNLLFAPSARAPQACPRHEHETRYLSLLPQVRHYTISHRQLQLFDSEHEQPLLVFEAK